MTAEARRRPGGADGAGDGRMGGQAGARDARQQIGAQRGFAAEQMRAAADVEQDAVGRIKRDQRRIAQAPVGDGIEQAGVGGCVFRHGHERRMHGARLRQRQPGVEAEPLRRRVDRRQQIEIAALAVDDERELPSLRSGMRGCLFAATRTV